MAKVFGNDVYHREQMAEAGHQFDEVETTISHLFRFAHPALQGLTFGETLARQMSLRRPAPSRVVEVGGGTGFLAESVVRMLERDASAPQSYSIVELSPQMQRAQRNKLTQSCFDFVTGTATQLPFKDASIDGWLLCNEVIADLDVVEFNTNETSSDDALDFSARALARKYRLKFSGATERARINLGAIQLVEEVSRVLAPGAVAYISEFAATNEVKPVELTDLAGQHAHTEYSILFDHLAAVAQSRGLSAEIIPMIRFLEFDAKTRVCNLNDALSVRFFHPHIEIFAYTPEQLGERIGAHRVSGLQLRFPEVGGVGFPDNHTRPMAESFQCLLLRKN